MHGRRLASFFLVLAALFCAVNCGGPKNTQPPAAAQSTFPGKLLVDFESPDPPVIWQPLALSAATEPAETQPASPLQRSSQRPQSGLWCMMTTTDAPGTLVYTPPEPLDLGAFDLLSIPIAHVDAPGRNGLFTAEIQLTDANGRKARGDVFAVLARWQPMLFDLKAAFDNANLDISRIASIAIVLRSNALIEAPLAIQTDAWSGLTIERTFFGSRSGPPRSFYVDVRGPRLRVGSVDLFELSLLDRGTSPDDAPTRPWLEIRTGRDRIQSLGTPDTGLLLLDQLALESLNGFRRQTADDEPVPAPNQPQWKLPTRSWPTNAPSATSHIKWEVVWTSPVAAIIEGSEECGPYDQLGEPALVIHWRFMVYQWGQIFVNARWTKGNTQSTNPVSWALLLDDAVTPASQPSLRPAAGTGDPERLLAEIYPQPLRDGLRTALPHRMQTGAAISMIAPLTPTKDSWWWAEGRIANDRPERRRFLGAGIPSNTANSTSCMLLALEPQPLVQAATFGQYLVPPKVIVRQGELDQRFPGDADNDGFVESYGFQVIRLNNGRASFDVYPQNRPLFYPPFLFTVPAIQSEQINLKNANLLVNIDGKQFANPPQFPDGSFLLQIPYKLDRPVSVEVVLVPKH